MLLDLVETRGGDVGSRHHAGILPCIGGMIHDRLTVVGLAFVRIIRIYLNIGQERARGSLNGIGIRRGDAGCPESGVGPVFQGDSAFDRGIGRLPRIVTSNIALPFQVGGCILEYIVNIVWLESFRGKR